MYKKIILILAIIAILLSTGVVFADLDGFSDIQEFCIKNDYVADELHVVLDDGSIGESYVNINDMDRVRVTYTEGQIDDGEYKKMGTN